MTEVVDPIQATGLQSVFDGQGSAAETAFQFAAMAPSAESFDGPAAPIHCRRPMILAEAAASGSTNLEWTCACGFRKDTAPALTLHPLDGVWLAAARLESLQWELDAAQQALGKAVRAAAAQGAERTALRTAAGLTEAELEAVLQ
ncbi:hypothetical protein [Arthrobacter mangrovi]|uniref:Uncharacterized protein n=1 Tax=Arthrobacter mangrovi TaxID=2966350 RepID=A0ABQ5MVM2_9MICC|nr:hypothetical protein [Arthrobacter mangrovi]GLB67995.1 hypothetical protein AHIS1636_24370 [Arthrobacter mangrovi]